MQNRKIWILAAIVVAAAVVILVLVLNQGPDATQQWINCVNHQIGNPGAPACGPAPAG
jgi:hypothetical protein